jgi:beta-glucosidase
MSYTLARASISVGVGLLAGNLAGTALAGEPTPPAIDARIKAVLTVNGKQFRDANGNGQLDPYENWQLAVDKRVDDLLNRMTPVEKAGMMLIDTLNAEKGGRISDTAVRYIQDEKMTRFIFRNQVTATPDPTKPAGRAGADVTPYEAAQFMNMIQELAESTRLGIPVMFKSNARNHFEHDARPGINVAAGSFSEWPKEAGLAATRDMDLIADFARTMASEWTAVGLRGMYGYMADLSTEPRWYRVHETFTEDADLASQIMTVLVKNLQGEQLNPRSVALTMKHFPGGGPQEGGADPHYEFGKNQAYPANMFDYHVKPFKAALEAGVSAIMPYYGIPIGQKYQPNNVGMAFSKGIVTDLLRNELGFKGYVNSDTGIIGTRAWGLEGKPVEEQIAVAIDAGTDVLSGFNSNKQIMGLVTSGRVPETRLDDSVRRLLTEQFRLGLFEDPYVDPNRAAYLLGNRAFQRKAEQAQRKSIVLLQNKKQLLPLPAPTKEKPIKLYTMGMKPDVVGDKQWGYTVVSGDYDATKNQTRATVPSDTDYAILRVEVSNQGANPDLIFGGANPDEINLLAFSDMENAKSWHVSPSLKDIQEVMNKVGPENTILSIYFRQPYVLDEGSGMRKAGAILAALGVSDAALMDVLTGRFKPAGKLPFALANNAQALMKQAPDAPGYEKEDTLFAFGHGLTY